jgi:hypothetical protein
MNFYPARPAEIKKRNAATNAIFGNDNVSQNQVFPSRLFTFGRLELKKSKSLSLLYI